uniref:Thiamine-monophosphate kinase n=1 Tax=uncultured marine thaumarchaeote KM3_06_C02 TaxID=1455976 RepID=A0A075G9T2_9ARCH|nr:thiamine-monophosphate kinase (thiL) [uncultured marine thaumarchaeote KM3_06_C02]
MMDLKNLGERKIIELLTKRFDVMPNSKLQFTDDVSTIELGGGKLAILNVDMLVQSTDILPGMSYRQVARKAVVMTVSDFASKGVQPLGILTSLGLPSTMRKKDIEEIAYGLNAGAREYGSYVIGGDTNESKELIIDCMCFGITNEKHLMKRSGAKPGDILAVTGLFGDTTSAMKILLDDEKAPPELMNNLLEKVYLPQARLKEGLALAEVGAVTSSIDSSDGLAHSLRELSISSGVGFEIDVLPGSPSTLAFSSISGLEESQLIFYGGEEYEIVFTVPPKKWKKVEGAITSIGGKLIKIGKVNSSRNIIFKDKGKRRILGSSGWEHFQ